MSQITFDTLKFAKKLKQSGVPDTQAEAQAEAFAEIFTVSIENLVTKDDLNLGLERVDRKIDSAVERIDQKIENIVERIERKMELLAERLEKKIELNRSETRGEIILLRWMFGFLLAAFVGILIRLFMLKGI